MTAKKIAQSIARFASDKKAEDIVILDMRKVVNFCDYFVLCSGNTDRHVKAIADAISEGLDSLDIHLRHRQSFKNTNWIVFDAGDVVTHIFDKPVREFYQLEYLWQDAKKIPFKDN